MQTLTAAECELLLAGLPAPTAGGQRGRSWESAQSAPRWLSGDIWNDLKRQFAQRFCPRLGELLRAELSSRELADAETSSSPSSCILWGSVEPLEETLGFELDGRLVGPLVTRLLGGDATDGSATRGGGGRSLSPMERRLLERVVGLAAEEFCQCLQERTGVPLSAESFRFRSDSTGGAEWPEPDLVFSRLRIGIQGGGIQGGLNWWIPEGLVDLIAPPTEEVDCSPRLDRDEESPLLPEIDVVAQLGEVTFSAEEWLQLAVGDVIVTGQPSQGAVTVILPGGDTLPGDAGVWSGRKVVRVGDSSRPPAE